MQLADPWLCFTADLARPNHSGRARKARSDDSPCRSQGCIGRSILQRMSYDHTVLHGTHHEMLFKTRSLLNVFLPSKTCRREEFLFVSILLRHAQRSTRTRHWRQRLGHLQARVRAGNGNLPHVAPARLRRARLSQFLRDLTRMISASLAVDQLRYVADRTAGV